MPPESDEELRRKVDRQGWMLKNLTDGYAQIAREVRDVRKDQEADHETLIKFVAAAESATRAAEKAAVNGVTSKQLYISFAGAVIAIVGVLLGIHN